MPSNNTKMAKSGGGKHKISASNTNKSKMKGAKKVKSTLKMKGKHGKTTPKGVNMQRVTRRPE